MSIWMAVGFVPLDPAVVMRDIDTAPLHVPGLLSAAEAWLSGPEAGDR